MLRVQRINKARRLRRKKHIRKTITGTAEKPRFTITKSLNHIYGQLIDDVTGSTLVSASSIDKELKAQIKSDMKMMEICKLVGENLAKRALEKNIKNVSFDRNGYLYHGRIKATADAARKGGLEF
jgi:large subunit ribosomal protein L18